MAHLDHIAFVLKSLEPVRARCIDLGLAVGETERFDAEGTAECYIGSGAGRVLLIEPIADGPYADALERRGPGLHHIALNVKDLDAFVSQCVVGSGWFLHPSSLRTREQSSTAWLARPGVEALVELHKTDSAPDSARTAEQVVVAGLDSHARLASIFDDAEVPVVPGRRGDVFIAGESLLQASSVGVDEVFRYNQDAWDAQVDSGNRWTVPVSPAVVEDARSGSFELVLTPTIPVPMDWFGKLVGADVLCLASGGGQQGPVLASAGANVTVFDASDAQLQRDRDVAARDGLSIETVQGDMRDLSAFDDQSFDLIVHPCSNCFVAEVRPVWRESFRILRPGGHLLSGFNNPVSYCFDWGSVERGNPQLRYALPYRDIDHLDDPTVARYHAAGDPLEFGHTLDDQIGGQLAAGFELVGFFEDGWGSGFFPDGFFPGFMATRARRPLR